MLKKELDTVYPVIPDHIITDRTTQLFVPVGQRLDVTTQLKTGDTDYRAGMYVGVRQDGFYDAGKLHTTPEVPGPQSWYDALAASPWIGPITVSSSRVESAPFYLLMPSVAGANLYQAPAADNSLHDQFGVVEIAPDWHAGERGLALNISRPLAPYLGVSAVQLEIKPVGSPLHA